MRLVQTTSRSFFCCSLHRSACVQPLMVLFVYVLRCFSNGIQGMELCRLKPSRFSMKWVTWCCHFYQLIKRSPEIGDVERSGMKVERQPLVWTKQLAAAFKDELRKSLPVRSFEINAVSCLLYYSSINSCQRHLAFAAELSFAWKYGGIDSSSQRAGRPQALNMVCWWWMDFWWSKHGAVNWAATPS